MAVMVCPISKRQTFLVASDNSEYSKHAIREAIRLAKICSSKLITVSVVKTNLEFDTVLPQLVEKEEQAALRHLEAVRKQAERQGVDCEIVVSLSEEPYQDIIDRAINKKADMIVMGTHGKTGIIRLMMGSVTAKVIGHAPCNVLVLPLGSTLECKNILVATDGSKYSDAAASEAIGMAQRCGSSLTVVSVASSEEEIESAHKNVHGVSAVAEQEGLRTALVVTKGKPYDAILKIALRKKADIIILGSHGRTGLERLLMGSVTERVIGHATAAVLVVKKPH